jgi:hypothetical protein
VIYTSNRRGVGLRRLNSRGILGKPPISPLIMHSICMESLPFFFYYNDQGLNITPTIQVFYTILFLQKP